jgi:hypothetical protein
MADARDNLRCLIRESTGGGGEHATWPREFRETEVSYLEIVQTAFHEAENAIV